MELKNNLYTVYDRVAETYSAPFIAQNDNHAKLIFKYNCAAHGISRPSDQVLFCVGSFNLIQGTLESNSQIFVCNGEDTWLEEVLLQKIAELGKATDMYNSALSDYQKFLKEMEKNVSTV